MPVRRVSIFPLASAVVFALAPTALYPAGDHAGGHQEPLETMREMHRSHEHEHDFDVMDEMTDEQRLRLNTFLKSVGLVLPSMSSHRGREVFLEKGCVVCHSVNGIGGDVGPSFNAADMPSPMNAFEFAARMWRGAPAMVLMQEEQMGDFINLTGEELADLVAFVHDAEEQEELIIDQVPNRFREMIHP
ncbi:c-type cytochrome [Roseovarius nitratireducens]|uniref:c-type cytochrome n=1 Tax=Roseovarius nitratireducens TaxID=2044597 RepID=UPI001F0CCB4C|nr:cytochrome c [Roseovarius nitratireducens]